MIERYTHPEMGKVWTEYSKFQKMLEVEKMVSRVQGELDIIPKKASLIIQKKAQFDLNSIHKREENSQHDVVAFVEEVSSKVGNPYGRYIHFGLTSSDVLDTALSLQIRDSDKVLKSAFNQLETSLLFQIRKHKNTLCPGRTHGMHAEPTSFGFKLSGFLAEFYRNKKRYAQALKDTLVGKLSGPVGTYSLLSEKVEKKCCSLLKLKPEAIATQVIPRDRHAHLIHSLSLIGSFLERLSIELRHLQRTEVGEVTESFLKNQKGSSAMPHKKNPVSAENITGISRLLRSYALSAMENISLWHERDISHSSVERVIFPDSFILCDYAIRRMAHLLKNLQVNKKRMLENMSLSEGSLYTASLLSALIKKGLTRQKAYKLLQSLTHEHLKQEDKGAALNTQKQETFIPSWVQDKSLQKHLNLKELKHIFSGQFHQDALQKLLRDRMKKNFQKLKT